MSYLRHRFDGLQPASLNTLEVAIQDSLGMSLEDAGHSMGWVPNLKTGYRIFR
jgi:hypothetical protein